MTCPLSTPTFNYAEFVNASLSAKHANGTRGEQWALFIFYSWNLEVTRQTLASLQDMRPNIIFVDNTRRLNPSKVTLLLILARPYC
jgi:hypothetical protein